MLKLQYKNALHQILYVAQKGMVIKMEDNIETENKKSAQGRRFQVTINNPEDKGFFDEVIVEKLGEFKSLVYYCFGHEFAPTTGTPHVHIYFVVKTPTRFSTVRNRFAGAHVEVCRGTSEQNRAYVLKECGIDGDFVEWGKLPQERQGHPRYMDELFALICEGKSDYEIYKSNPAYIQHASQIARVREAVQQENARTKKREVSVVYVQAVETVATKYVMERFGMEAVYRAGTEHPFDHYEGQRVLYFPAFDGTIPLHEFLGYCGGFPVQLPARYANRWAAFETIVLASTQGIEEQYSNAKFSDRASWVEFLRTIGEIVEFDENGQPVTPTSSDEEHTQLPTFGGLDISYGEDSV